MNYKIIPIIAVSLLFTACMISQLPKNKKKPNIVFILVDDLGYADVGFNGSTYFETPFMDALAKESLVFDNAYMYPTCSPSRAALFTGKQSFRTGVYSVPVLEKGDANENIFSRWTVGKEHPIYAKPLAEEGYKAIHLGKWHIVGPYPEKELAMNWPISKRLEQPKAGDFSWLAEHKKEFVQQYYPEGRGFIQNVGGTFRGDPALEEGGYKSYTGGYRAPFSNPFIEPKPNDEWLTDRLTNDAIEFIEEHKDESFLVNLNFYAVHRPIKNRSEDSFKKYMSKPGDSVTGQGMGDEKQKERTASYATMVASMDENIGKIVAYLNRNELRENTVIIVTSDNGYHSIASENKKLRGAKGEIYEGGIKVPALINWPNKIKARRTKAPISAVDYFPTLMSLSGIDYKGQLDGQSITEIFEKDSNGSLERPLFWHVASQYKHGTCSVIRQGNYKLIQFLATGKLDLYNLDNDPIESINLVDKEPDVKNRLLAQLENWRHDNQVPLPPNAVVEN